MSFARIFLWRFTWDELAPLCADKKDRYRPPLSMLARACIGRRQRRIWREDIKRLAAGGRHEPIVYFGLVGRHVKIGTTTNLRVRMGTFYWGTEDVLAIVPGGRKLEEAYHDRFRKSRIKDDGRSELFYLTPDLRVFLSRRRVDFWDIANSFCIADFVLCGFVWIGWRALPLAGLTWAGGVAFQFMRPGWNYCFLPPLRQEIKTAIGYLKEAL